MTTRMPHRTVNLEVDTGGKGKDNPQLFLQLQLEKRSTLANIASAKKRARQAENNRVRNAALRSRLRTYIKKVILAVDSGDLTKAQEAFRQAVPIIDSSVNKGLIHRNKAARSKSRLNARVKALALKAAS
jgi:small subunit ribosomal protein S20